MNVFSYNATHYQNNVVVNAIEKLFYDYFVITHTY